MVIELVRIIFERTCICQMYKTKLNSFTISMKSWQ